jgi:hypothetical protein
MNFENINMLKILNSDTNILLLECYILLVTAHIDNLKRRTISYQHFLECTGLKVSYIKCNSNNINIYLSQKTREVLKTYSDIEDYMTLSKSKKIYNSDFENLSK